MKILTEKLLGKGILQNSEQNWYKFDYVENEIQEENYYKEISEQFVI
ncbi:MAG: hypothetical protein ACLT69_08725 [Intestinibacter bartlettii]